MAGELPLTQDLPDGFFTDWPAQTGAPWLLLLDALDEVPADQRPRLMQWLRGVLRSIQQHGVVITSRPAGYRYGELDEGQFNHYDLLPFTPEQASDFARQWFGEGADHFLQELERVRVGDLRSTPLLLTIAAKVYLEKGALPERRSALYGQFVDVWLRETAQRGLEAELGDKLAGPTDLQVTRLAHLALRMTEGPGDASLQTLAHFTAGHLEVEEGFRHIHGATYGKEFVEVMARRSGVFLRRGETYSFVHPTFREYLAACALLTAWGDDLSQVATFLNDHWQDNAWWEVLLFALGLLSDRGADVSDLLKPLLGPERESTLFTGSALAEGVSVTPELSDHIVDRLLGVAREIGWWEGVAAISLLGRLHGHRCAADGLLALAHEPAVDAMTRLDAAGALWNLRQVDAATDAYLAVARDPAVACSERVKAAEALGELDQKEEATSILLDMLQAETLPNVDQELLPEDRDQAIGTLMAWGRIGEVAPILLALACDPGVRYNDELDDLREQATWVLERLGQHDKAASVLVDLAHDTEKDAEERIVAATVLRDLERGDEVAANRQPQGLIGVYLALARDSAAHYWIRLEAMESLGWWLGRWDEAAPILLALVREDDFCDTYGLDDVHAQARWVLDELDLEDEAASALLLSLAYDTSLDPGARMLAAVVLGALDRGEEAASILTALAHDISVDVGVRSEATEALRHLGRET